MCQRQRHLTRFVRNGSIQRPPTFDIGCPSSLVSSFVIEIQKYAGRIELDEFSKQDEN